MKNPTETESIASQQALRDARDALKGARLAAKASKARLRALKSEVKVQRQHYKSARNLVRAAKQELAQWKATAAAAEADPDAEAKPGEPPTALELQRAHLAPVAPGHVDRVAPVPPGSDEKPESFNAGDAAGAAAGKASASSRPRARS